MQWIKWILWAILAVVVIYLLLWSITPYFISTKKEYTKDSKYYRWLLYTSTGIATKILRIKFHITGMEKIPTDTRVLFVCNHRSNFDPIVSWWIFRKFNPSFISKPENFKVPIYGRIIRRCLFQAIDRSNPRSSMQTIIKAVKIIKDDQASIFVYPEGTRSKKLKLLKFHNGVFKIAHKAEVPVVVLCIKGSETVKDRYPFHRSHIYIDVLDVIPVDYIKENGTDLTSDRARTLMLKHLGEAEE